MTDSSLQIGIVGGACLIDLDPHSEGARISIFVHRDASRIYLDDSQTEFVTGIGSIKRDDLRRLRASIDNWLRTHG